METLGFRVLMTGGAARRAADPRVSAVRIPSFPGYTWIGEPDAAQERALRDACLFRRGADW